MQMKLLAFVVAALLGRPLYVLAEDPNCVQPEYLVSRLPAGLDPNLVEGLLLPPVPGDEATWKVAVGKFNRTAAACDPEGHSFELSLVASTAPVTLSLDAAAATWTLATESLPGVNCVVVEATDAYGAAQRFTVLWLGTGNRPPVLE